MDKESGVDVYVGAVTGKRASSRDGLGTLAQHPTSRQQSKKQHEVAALPNYGAQVVKKNRRKQKAHWLATAQEEEWKNSTLLSKFLAVERKLQIEKRKQQNAVAAAKLTTAQETQSPPQTVLLSGERNDSAGVILLPPGIPLDVPPGIPLDALSRKRCHAISFDSAEAKSEVPPLKRNNAPVNCDAASAHGLTSGRPRTVTPSFGALDGTGAEQSDLGSFDLDFDLPHGSSNVNRADDIVNNISPIALKRCMELNDCIDSTPSLDEWKKDQIKWKVRMTSVSRQMLLEFAQTGTITPSSQELFEMMSSASSKTAKRSSTRSVRRGPKFGRNQVMPDEDLMEVAAMLARQKSKLSGKEVDPNVIFRKVKDSRGQRLIL